MKPIIIQSFLLIALIAHPAQAKQDVNERITTDAQPVVKIEHQKGDVSIKGWAQDAVEITGTLYDDDAELVVKQNGRVVSIELRNSHKKDGYFWNKGQNYSRSDLTVMVPVGADVDFTSLNGDVNIAQVNGEIDVELVNGEIIVNEAKGDLALVTVNGAIEAKRVSGRLNLETVNGGMEIEHSSQENVKLGSVNGDIVLTTVSPDVTISAVNADMDLQLSNIDDLSVDMVNGTVEAVLALLPGGKIDASSVDGRMTFRFTEEVSARINVDAHAGGRINNELSADKVEKQKYGPASSLNFTAGDGDGRINIDTVSGRITLKRD